MRKIKHNPEIVVAAQVELRRRKRPDASDCLSPVARRLLAVRFLLMPVACCLLPLVLSGCRQQMAEQPRYDPLEASDFFADGQSARHPVENTVARGNLREDEHLYEGISNGAPATTFPFPITSEIMERGRERYDVFCSPCHSRTGNGDGMIVRRGFTRPASFHIDRLREAPPGYIFGVITNGFAAMPSYRQQIGVDDRWAIAAYLRALQASQSANVNELPAQAQKQLMAESR